MNDTTLIEEARSASPSRLNAATNGFSSDPNPATRLRTSRLIEPPFEPFALSPPAIRLISYAVRVRLCSSTVWTTHAVVRIVRSRPRMRPVHWLCSSTVRTCGGGGGIFSKNQLDEQEPEQEPEPERGVKALLLLGGRRHERTFPRREANELALALLAGRGDAAHER